MAAPRERVLVLGGGAGGLELACALGDRAELDVTLVDRHGAHVWKPRLHELAAGTVNSTLAEMSFYMLAGMRGFTFEQGSVERVDRAARSVRLAPLADGEGHVECPARELAYDRLVIALGGVTPDFGTAGVEEHAVRLDERSDADDFHERLIATIIRARTMGVRARIAIIGSGATGTELAAHLRLAEVSFLDSEHGAREEPLLDITILEAAPEIMPGASDALRQAVCERMETIGIRLRTGAKIASVDAAGVTSADGETWPADITVWAAGLVGNPVLATLSDFDMDKKGRIVVDPYLRSTVDDRILVLGDAASCTPKDRDSPLPPTAQCASQQASYLAKSIPLLVSGGDPESFHFRDKGRLLSFARGGSVGNIGFGSRKDILVHGQFAKAAYEGLQRQHQWSVLGTLRGSVAILADIMSPAKGPALKLHG